MAKNPQVSASNRRRARHNMHKTPIYRSWVGMKQRCDNPNSPHFHRYGGRGINVCPAWGEFEGFLADMGPSYFPGGTLDRMDNDKGYCPENCRWVSRRTQSNNRGNNVRVTHKGETRTLSEWSAATGIARHILAYRYSQGWDADKLFTTDDLRGTNTQKIYVVYEGRKVTLKEAAALSGIKYQTLYARLRLGQPLF